MASASDIAGSCVELEGVGYDRAHLESYARCAADAYCAQYGVPGGVCGEVASRLFRPIADAVEDVFSNAGGAQSPVWWSLAQLRALHDRLFPGLSPWNTATAWTTGTLVTPGLRVPDELGRLVLQHGFDLRSFPELFSPLDNLVKSPGHETKKLQALRALSGAQAELVARKTDEEARAAAGARPALFGSGLGSVFTGGDELSLRESQMRAHRVVVPESERSAIRSAALVGGAAMLAAGISIGLALL